MGKSRWDDPRGWAARDPVKVAGWGEGANTPAEPLLQVLPAFSAALATCGMNVDKVRVQVGNNWEFQVLKGRMALALGQFADETADVMVVHGITFTAFSQPKPWAKPVVAELVPVRL